MGRGCSAEAGSSAKLYCRSGLTENRRIFCSDAVMKQDREPCPFECRNAESRGALSGGWPVRPRYSSEAKSPRDKFVVGRDRSYGNVQQRQYQQSQARVWPAQPPSTPRNCCRHRPSAARTALRDEWACYSAHIDEGKLFQEVQLDEPWDSEHTSSVGRDAQGYATWGQDQGAYTPFYQACVGTTPWLSLVWTSNVRWEQRDKDYSKS